MNKSRNKKSKSNSESENNIDIDNNQDNNIDMDKQYQKDENIDEDDFDYSDMSDEIEQKIDSIRGRNKRDRTHMNYNENNFIFQDTKEEKKKKEKYDKKIMKNNFNDYFDLS